MNKNYQEKIEDLLPLVMKPSRYLNHELNSYHKDTNISARICLCFPDVYEIGISNQSIEILYHIVNQSEHWSAERSYCPGSDMEKQLQDNALPLCSIESGKPLRSFDIVGFTLQNELCYTNVLHMLELAGIQKRADMRKEVFPLIIGGGPCSANPEPAADFFDAFVLGDGEDVIKEIMSLVEECRKNHCTDKQKVFQDLSKIEGVYVPSLYSVTYYADGRVESVVPKNTRMPAKITKQVVDLEKTFHVEKPLVPYLHAVHDRLTLEIARGCVHSCRFCQASRTQGPVRQRSVEKLLDIVEKGLNATGFEEIALSALSTSDYTHIEQLVDALIKKYAHKRIALSLPSLRCSTRSLKLAQSTRVVKKSSLTFAPEAGTKRMWAVINKSMDGDNIVHVLKTAGESGWKQIKLYFMYGLPWEKDEDMQGISDLIRQVRKGNKRLNFNVAISPFIPKAHTPFQWCSQDNLQTLEQKRSTLVKKIPGNVKPHQIETSFMEAVFARGDRRLSACILRAYELGCKFDQWREGFRFDLWQQAFAECGIDPVFYTARVREADEVFPWDHLVFSHSKERLYEEYTKAKITAETWDNEALDNAAQEGDQSEIISSSKTHDMRPLPNTPVQRVRLRLRRSGRARFLSHLEQITAIRRTFRRADLPMVYTQGFHPQPKISFGPAISVSYSSDAEYVDVELAQRMDLEAIKKLIESQLPRGFTLLTIKRIPVFFPSLESVLNQVKYDVAGNWPQEAQGLVESFKKKNEVWIEKIKKGKTERINISPIVKNISLKNGSVELLMDFGPKKNIKPSLLLGQIFKLSEKEVASLRVHKVALYIAKQNRKSFEP